MCRHAVRELPPTPASAPAARRFLTETATAWGLEDLVDDAQIALSELVTNGVLHARTPLTVSLAADHGSFELAVLDGDPELPSARPARTDVGADVDEAARLLQDLDGTATDDRDPALHVGEAGSVAGGRGLLLVEALADEWGANPHGDGKAVWARLGAPDGWPWSEGCPCSGADGATVLPSGRPVLERD